MTTLAPQKKGSGQSTRPSTSPSVPGNGQAGVAQPAPSHDQIARCAYDIYIAHGRVDGRSDLDWRQAEEELAQTPRVSWPKA
jgi:hypothetical protein